MVKRVFRLSAPSFALAFHQSFLYLIKVKVATDSGLPDGVCLASQGTPRKQIGRQKGHTIDLSQYNNSNIRR